MFWVAAVGHMMCQFNNNLVVMCKPLAKMCYLYQLWHRCITVVPHWKLLGLICHQTWLKHCKSTKTAKVGKEQWDFLVSHRQGLDSSWKRTIYNFGWVRRVRKNASCLSESLEASDAVRWVADDTYWRANPRNGQLVASLININEVPKDSFQLLSIA